MMAYEGQATKWAAQAHIVYGEVGFFQMGEGFKFKMQALSQLSGEAMSIIVSMR